MQLNGNNEKKPKVLREEYSLRCIENLCNLKLCKLTIIEKTSYIA